MRMKIEATVTKTANTPRIEIARRVALDWSPFPYFTAAKRPMSRHRSSMWVADSAQLLINGTIGYWLSHSDKPTYRDLAESREHIGRATHTQLARLWNRGIVLDCRKKWCFLKSKLKRK